MATFTLTSREVVGIRSLLGIRLDPVSLPDTVIKSEQYVEPACDYVFSTIREGIALDKPTTITELYALFGPVGSDAAAQQDQRFRQAIVYRVAALLVPSVSFLLGESAGGVNQQFQPPPNWELLQASLLLRCDEQIEIMDKFMRDDMLEDPGKVRIRTQGFTFFRTVSLGG